METRRLGRPWLAAIAGLALLWSSPALAQTVAPSNGTQDLYPASTSPRFLLNGTEFPSGLPPVRLAPLGPYAEMSQDNFLRVHVVGHLVIMDASNANDVADTDQFSFLSCDPAQYTGNLDASDVFRIVVNSPRANIVILYSVTSNHCSATGISNLPTIGGILTTTDPMAAATLAAMNLTQPSPGMATILPDLNSYNNASGNAWSGSLGQSPTTAVAMIILYSITGIITALFVVIIVTGAIRAHRHPERYGPRNIMGRGRQSRAKGIARAMLETLPIVKFGDHPDLATKPVDGADVEMNGASTDRPPSDSDPAADPTAAGGDGTSSESSVERAVPAAVDAVNPDGTDAEGHLGCSICTEDFNRGEEVRVLPCNHKFHPDCVDPWLLNVSGTCPLCRIDLRPPTSDAAGEDEPAVRRTSSATVSTSADGQLPPPLPMAGRRDTLSHWRHLAHGSRDERIAALRRLRQEALRSGSRRASNATEEDRSGLAHRFRERFRIRTVRRGTISEP